MYSDSEERLSRDFEREEIENKNIDELTGTVRDIPPEYAANWAAVESATSSRRDAAEEVTPELIAATTQIIAATVHVKHQTPEL